MNDIEAYFAARNEQMSKNLVDRDLRVMTERLFSQIVRTNWVKQFTWMGVPIMVTHGSYGHAGTVMGN